MTANPLWQAEDVIRAVRGQCLHEQTWKASGVSIDSRTVEAGDLFIALQGPAHDGHDHVADAIRKGAAAAMVSRQPSQVPSDASLIFVNDTFIALQELGRAGRARATGKIIAVTGSVGKTSTKEMLRLMLASVSSTYASQGGLNNHWGAPLSLARLPPDAIYGVFEMGMNHAGEMTELTQMVRPHIALITTVEAVHLEFFASTEAIADAKAEIFQGMDAQGIAVLNRDNPHYARLANVAKNCGVKKILSFGSTSKADAHIIDYALTPEGSAVNATIMGYNIHYSVGAPGMHVVLNSLAALLTATVASNAIEECAVALSYYKLPEGRGAKISISMAGGGNFTLVDESYNASPVAVRAAIEVLGQASPAPGGRRVLVLGDMRELGATAPDLHADLAPAIIAAQIDSVFCCGEMMQYLYDALPTYLQGGHTADSAALMPLVVQSIHAGDIVTIKGSLSMKMNSIVVALKNLDVSPNHKIAS